MAKLPDDVKEKYIQAGKIAAESLRHGASLIKVGASLLDVTERTEEKLLDLGGEFAFPPQISLNRIAAHYCAEPDDETIFQKGDVAKIDVGAMIDGYIGDNATTVNLGDHDRLVEASRKALDAALALVRPGTPVSQIGRAVNDTITGYGFLPVRNLSGHGLDEYVYHGRPSIPNFDNGDQTVLEEGMVIAIEPFASAGTGMVFESGAGNVFSQVDRKQVRSQFTREILKEVETYNNMPFTTRWLTRKFPAMKVNFALREMLMSGIIRSYPPLPDRTGGLVSQAEHTVIVEDTPIVTTRI